MDQDQWGCPELVHPLTDPRALSRNTTFSDTVSAYRCACIHRDQGSVGLREVVFLPRRASSDLTTDPRSSLPVLKQGWTYYPLDQGSAPRKDGSYKAVWSWVYPESFSLGAL